MAFAPDGRLFVCEKAGRLRVIVAGVLQDEPFLTLDVQTTGSGGSNGLLGVAFDPRFVTNGHFYVHYTVKATSTTPAHNRVSRFTASGDAADPSSEVILIELPQIAATGGEAHYGGDLGFGVDGKLYIPVGDYGSPASAQLLTSIKGKMLRMNADGSIPEDNPFYSTASGMLRAIWAVGLRNPFTFAVDPLTGRMFINDVGELAFEEINNGLPGANYGWPQSEGPSSNPQHESPVHSYGRGQGCALTAGTFFHPIGTPYPSNYVGRYFFADWCQGWIRTIDPDSPATASAFALGTVLPMDLEVGPDGRIYYIEWTQGSVYRIDFTPPAGPPPPATPFHGTPLPLPGTIQAEDFDAGGQGVAYLDSSAGNSGGRYRTTDVDIAAAVDAGGGFNVGWMVLGEWLQYTIDVAAGGAYTFEARVASGGAGGSFHVEVDGVNVSGPIVVPDTGGWQTWQTVTRGGVQIPAGLRRLRIVLDSAGASGFVGNLNYLQFTLVATTTPFSGTPLPVPGTIQAEDFDEGGHGFAYHDTSPGNSGGRYRTTDVDIATAVDAGGGFNVGYMTAGEWLLYTVDVAATGSYTLEARVAAGGGGGSFHVEVNGVNATGPITIPNTGGWQTWQTLVRTGIALTAGRRTLRLVVDSIGASSFAGNLNYLRFAAAGPATTPFFGTPRVIPGVLQGEDFDEGGEGLAYHDTSAGNAGGGYRSTDVDIQATSDTGGGFNIGWMAPGEWLAYTVDVGSTATYTIEARVAANGSGGTFHVEVNAVNVTGPLTVPNTGGWQSWQTVTRTGIPLTAGRRTVRVVLDTAGPGGFVGNLNFLRFTVATGTTPFSGTPIPGLIQAEDFDEGGEGLAYHDTSPGNTGGRYRSTDVDIASALDAGGGFNVGFTVPGEWLVFTIDVASAGTYMLEARVAASGTGGAFHVEINGTNVTGSVSVPSTGGWQTWQTVSVPGIGLTAGRSTMRLVFDSAGPSGFVGNLNHLRWTSP